MNSLILTLSFVIGCIMGVIIGYRFAIIQQHKEISKVLDAELERLNIALNLLDKYDGIDNEDIKQIVKKRKEELGD